MNSFEEGSLTSFSLCMVYGLLFVVVLLDTFGYVSPDRTLRPSPGMCEL